MKTKFNVGHGLLGGFSCIFLVVIFSMTITSCEENYSNGERIGLITKFTSAGAIWKSYEGELHVTQTGMNSTATEFDFSVDNDRTPDPNIINTLDSAANKGWKVKIRYHQVWGMKNVFANRGHTDVFVDGVDVLDKNPMSAFSNKSAVNTGHIIDTIYVLIVGKASDKKVK